MAKRYFMGILPGSPVTKTTFGGYEFVDFKEHVRINPSDGETQRIPYKGSGSRGIELEEDEVAAIKKGIESHVARTRMAKEIDGWSGKEIMTKVSGDFYKVRTDRKFRPEKTDEPVGRYVYFLPLEDVKNPAVFEYGNDSYPPSYEDMYLKKNEPKKKPRQKKLQTVSDQG